MKYELYSMVEKKNKYTYMSSHKEYSLILPNFLGCLAPNGHVK